MNLYSTHASEFSKTRQIPWKGWENILPYNKNKEISVLDLGCGNGRFYKFLLDNDIKVIDYTGIDSSQELLNIFRTDIENVKLKSESVFNYDLIESELNENSWTSNIVRTYDLIANFGLMHHLKSDTERDNILRESKKFLTDDGLIFVSFWQFLNFERTKNKIVKDLGNNDFYLSFGTKDATRFCHFTSKEEARSIAKEAGLKIVDEYFADGENEKLNYYLVLKKY